MKTEGANGRMNVFVITTSTGVWSVASTREVAEQEAKLAKRTELNVRIDECGVLTKSFE